MNESAEYFEDSPIIKYKAKSNTANWEKGSIFILTDQGEYYSRPHDLYLSITFVETSGEFELCQPCPDCGGEKEIMVDTPGIGGHMVPCRRCGEGEE